MNRTELIARVSGSAGVTRRQAESVIDNAIYEITSAVREGDLVRITGFGTFRARDRAARPGRNPRTGATVRIKASRGIGFSAGATLRRQLNTRGALPKPDGVTPAVAAVKKAAPKKAAPAKKAAPKKAGVKKAPAKKAAPATKAAPAKKAVVKKTAAKRALKKAPAKKATVKKAPAKRAAKKR